MRRWKCSVARGELKLCQRRGGKAEKKHFLFYTSEDLRGFGKVSGSIRLEVVACREVMLCHQREKRPVSVSSNTENISLCLRCASNVVDCKKK